MLSFLPGLSAEGRGGGSQRAEPDGLGCRLAQHPKATHPVYCDSCAGKEASVPTGTLFAALWAKGEPWGAGMRMHLPTKYASRMTSVAEMTMALRAAHFQLQYLEGFLRLKAGRLKVLRGRGRGGGEYTVLDVSGYPGDVVQKSGEVPPGLKRKCLWMKRGQRASGSAS